MAVTDGFRRWLDGVTPPTSGRLGESGFLLAGAAAGAVGWGGTQVLTWLAPPNAAVAATSLWGVLMLGFSTATVRHGHRAVRFSDPMLLWGVVNGAAMALTVASVVGAVPGRLGFWYAWAAASAVGYLGTGMLLSRAGAGARGQGYLTSGVVTLAVLGLGIVAFEAVAPVAFLLLAAGHTVTLVMDVKTGLSPLARGGTLSVTVVVFLAVGLAV